MLCTRIYLTKQKVSKVAVQKVDLLFFIAQALRSHRLLCTRIYFTEQKVSEVAVQKVDLPYCSPSLEVSQVAVH